MSLFRREQSMPTSEEALKGRPTPLFPTRERTGGMKKFTTHIKQLTLHGVATTALCK